MPRRSPKAILQHSLARTMEFTALQILLWDDDDCNEDDVEFLEDLYALKSRRYIIAREQGSAGRHFGTHVLTTSSTDFQTQGSGHVLEWDVHPSSDLFISARIHWKRQRSLIRIVELNPHQVRYYQQVATALYILGSSGGSADRARILLDIGHGTIWEYTWRFIKLLVHLARRFISWPSPQQCRQLPVPLKPGKEIFSGCVGFLDGSEIPLQSKPK